MAFKDRPVGYSADHLRHQEKKHRKLRHECEVTVTTTENTGASEVVEDEITMVGTTDQSNGDVAQKTDIDETIDQSDEVLE